MGPAGRTAANEGGSSDVTLGRCLVLCDVTNSVSKMRFLSTKGDHVSDCGTPCWKIGDEKSKDDEFRRLVYIGVENLIKEKENARPILPCSEKELYGDGKNVLMHKRKYRCMDMRDSDEESSEENAYPSVSESDAPHEAMRLTSSKNVVMNLLGIDAARSEIIGDGPRDDISLMAKGDSQNNCGKINSHAMQITIKIGELEASTMSREMSDGGKYFASLRPISASNACTLQFVGSQEKKADGIENLSQISLGKPVSTSCLGESASLGTTVDGFEASAKLHGVYCGDSALTPNDCFVADKICSCPFCLKAAYIYSDLHYQDARDRLSALKKSRKQVRKLITSYNYNEADILDHDNFHKSFKMEMSLLHQWQSFFLHTEEIFVCETKRLQSELFKLKDIRDNCERDLQMIGSAP